MFSHLKKYKKNYFVLLFTIIVVFACLSYWANNIIKNSSKNFITYDIKEVKPTKVALL